MDEKVFALDNTELTSSQAVPTNAQGNRKTVNESFEMR